MKNNEIRVWKEKFENYLDNRPLDDGSHDMAHAQRVWRLAEKLSSKKEDKLIILAACYFHDIINYAKSDSRRSQSSKDAAVKAEDILTQMSFPENKLRSVAHCILAHSFSAKIPTETQEARIVQDADLSLAHIF